ncbi:MAG: UDP-2,4-diacetamido-2,4,6-trideoxy-beta-L-altropyranose hydrolase [Lachnospiraceae bacterium]|nr:UDP-2,4-diacetamido-2,4,6-trideoxy-beta-L-altropyranose hydrolase [Lachnospiraceae bacterium]
MLNILVVIPARGGSKRIPRKNVRIMNGKPLILYSIENAESLKNAFGADIVVSTDDEELMGIVRNHGVEVIEREGKLAGDKVTLDPVIYDALIKKEKSAGKSYDIVITMQATSPTLKKETLKDALEEFQKEGYDTMISCVNKPHLSWTKSDGKIIKNYEKRLNSQELPCNFLETGAFLITKRECVTEKSRIGENITVYETSAQEAVDIDTEEDWIAAESILKRKKILLFCVGQQRLGMGHIYRCLTIAYKLIGHEILFVTDSESTMGIEKLKESHFAMKVVSDRKEYEKVLEEYAPDVVINDVLDTDEELVKLEREHTSRIVNFEDMGPGAWLADAVINALYENRKNKPQNVYEGSDYFFIRDEFLEEKPKDFSDECRNIMIMFGGADPSDLTGKLYNICKTLHSEMKDVEFHFLTGFAYENKDNIQTDPENNIFVHHDAKRVSAYMKQADLCITSQGRTVFELASMGVPAVVLAQNEREAEHVFAGMGNGFINLGIGSKTDDITIIKTIMYLADMPRVRKEMRNLQLSRKFEKGQERVIKIILNEE